LLFILSLPFIESSVKYSIDKDRCNTDTTCFIRQSCLETETVDTVLVQYKDEVLKNGQCDVFLQIQPYSPFKFHGMMQVNSSTAPIFSEGVALKQGKDQ
ncbi:hypothetical protein PENTCL1PPCAC_7454, partial [Pristionchus entomophagus]